jgi:hypothetical protein
MGYGMTAILFYLGAAALCVMGSFCLRHTSPYTRAGGAKFEKRTKRKMLGYLVFVVAFICLIVAVIAQLANSP